MGSSETTAAATNKQKPAFKTQYIAAVSATLGGLCLGAAMGYSSPAGPMLMQNSTNNGSIQLTESENTWFSSSMNLGAIVGGPIGGLLIRNAGRRGSMLLVVFVFLLAWILTALSVNFAMLISSRIIVGLATGMTCITTNTYVAEIASPEIRGMIAGWFQLMLVSGIAYAYIFGAIMPTWQLIAVMCAIPPVLHFILMFLTKESPVYLLSKGKEKQAEISLQYFRGKDYDIQKELEMLKEVLAEGGSTKTSIKDLFTHTYLRKPLLISAGLMVFQQFAGVNAVLFNLTGIFQDAGTGLSESLSSILVGLTQVLATALSTFFIDRAGRKMLLIGSSCIMGMSLVALGVFFYFKEKGTTDSIGWLPLVSLIIFVTSFSFGLGPIPWVMMGELFPKSVSAEASSLETMLNWAMVFLSTFLFTPMQNALGDYGAYWIFASICFLSMFFSIVFVPETKGKTIEEISAYFGAPQFLTNNEKNDANGNINEGFVKDMTERM